jgi:REP element-mobilizing transposase RayT
MARRPRIHFPGAFYHVITRGNRLQKIFMEDADYELYLSFLREYKKRFGFLLYVYTLMPDHLHFLIEVSEVPLSRLMQSLQFRYSRNFNLKYGKWGHLFQGRYRAILCQKDAYLLELSAHIHLNAVRAGLVEDPLEYPWSSYRRYVNEVKKDGLIDADFLLAHFSEHKETARKEYSIFVMDRITDGQRDDFYQLKEQSFLGSDEFVQRVQRSLKNQEHSASDIPLEEIVSEAGSVLDIPVELFYTSSRNRQGAWARSVAAYMARKLTGCQVKSVAAHFNRDPVVISQGIRKVEERIREDGGVAEALTELERLLIG